MVTLPHRRKAFRSTPSGGGYSFPSVSNLICRFEADQITGLVDNDPVSTWPDSSASPHNATQTGTARPLWIASDINFNGNPSVKFDGSNDFMTANSLSATMPFTIFIAMRINMVKHHYMLDNAASPNRCACLASNGTFGNGFAFYSGGGPNSLATAPADTTMLAIFQPRSTSAGGFSFWKGNGSEITGSISTASLSSMNIGSNSQFFNGWIAGVWVIGGSDSTERINVRDYIMTKYGIS